jgi:hypothetical protein
VGFAALPRNRGLNDREPNGPLHLRPRLRHFRYPRNRAAGPSGASNVRQSPSTKPAKRRTPPLTAKKATLLRHSLLIATVKQLNLPKVSDY